MKLRREAAESARAMLNAGGRLYRLDTLGGQGAYAAGPGVMNIFGSVLELIMIHRGGSSLPLRYT